MDAEFRENQSIENPSAIFDQNGNRITQKADNLSVHLTKDYEDKCLESGDVGTKSLLNPDKRLKVMRKHRQKY